MKRLTKIDILNKVIADGYVLIDNGNYKFTALRINNETVKMTKGFEQQLKAEGKYDNSYITVIIPTTMEKCSMEFLPVFGSSEEYITKWLHTSLEDAIESALSDKLIGIVNRANEYLANKK